MLCLDLLCSVPRLRISSHRLPMPFCLLIQQLKRTTDCSHKIFGARNIFTCQTRIDDLETIILLAIELAEKDQRNLAFDILTEHTYEL